MNFDVLLRSPNGLSTDTFSKNLELYLESTIGLGSAHTLSAFRELILPRFVDF